MTELLPCKVGMRVRALCESPVSRAADTGWEGTVQSINPGQDRDQIVVLFDVHDMGGDPIDQGYLMIDWTPENVEILDGAQ